MESTGIPSIDTNGIDRLIVWRRGEIVLDHRDERARAPIELMSVTKSLVAMAICKMVDLGHLPSLDFPLHEMFPEWNQGLKRQVLLRHILAHTSCLQADRTTEEIYRSPDFVQLALCAELVGQPGTKFFYNNKAVNLLARVVEISSGRKLDQFVEEHFFSPLDISASHWALDQTGNPHAMAGLSLKGDDLLKFGLVMIHRGQWQQQQLLSQKMVDEMTSLGQSINPACGLLWWRLYDKTEFYFDHDLLSAYAEAKVPQEYIVKLNSIVDQRHPLSSYASVVASALGSRKSYNSFCQELNQKQLPFRRLWGQHLLGFNASGYLGQELLILPEHAIVGVRQVHWKTSEHAGNKYLPDLITTLAPIFQ